MIIRLELNWPGNRALTLSVSLILDYACFYATVPDTDTGVNAMVRSTWLSKASEYCCSVRSYPLAVRGR